MPIITSIKSQKNKKRVNVYLDGKFSFGIDLDNFVLLDLRVERELSDKEVAEIVKKAEFQKTLDKLLRFATLRSRSEKEINDWLKKKKVHISLFDKLLKRLRQIDLIDDYKFAKWWVEQRQNFRPKPKRIMNYELRMKGIDKSIIEDVLSQIDIDEEKIAKELLKRRSYKWEGLDLRAARQKKYEFLARKGFGWEVIGSVLK